MIKKLKTTWKHRLDIRVGDSDEVKPTIRAHLAPLGLGPVSVRPAASMVFKSMTVTPFPDATYAFGPSGCMRIPAAPFPRAISLCFLRAPASSTTRSRPPRSEMNTNLPSGVNFKRLAIVGPTVKVSTTDFLATSMFETVPPCELAAQTSLPSGDTSKPSGPFPTATWVALQPPPPGGPKRGGPPNPPPGPGRPPGPPCPSGPPGGGPPAFGAPGGGPLGGGPSGRGPPGPPSPGGPDGPGSPPGPPGPEPRSTRLMVSELTFEV